MKYYPSETTFFFDEYIYPNLIEYLKRAQSEIRICMAWLNDRDIFNLVLEALDRGIDIDINVNYNPSSNENNSTVELSKYIEKGGKISFITKKSADMLRIMHNKFCIIDKELVLTGSYNWSKSAQKNHENIDKKSFRECYPGVEGQSWTYLFDSHGCDNWYCQYYHGSVLN